MKKRIILLLSATLLILSVPALTASVSADESASSTIFRILTEDGGLNSAAACGILGNIQQECEFDPTAWTGSFYGLAQWSGSRIDNLRSFCSENGYDSESVEGQTYFIIHELENDYYGVYEALSEVPDTAEGAYTASCSFCHDYEQCGNYDWEYSTRGGYTDSFWDSYGGSVSDESEDMDETDETGLSEDEYASDDPDELTGSEDMDDEEEDTAAEDSDESEEIEDHDSVDPEEEGDYDSDDSEDGEDYDSENSEEDDGAYSSEEYRELRSGNYDIDLIFDYDYYVDRYPEVTEEAGTSYDEVLHYFLTYGVTMGQRGSQDFSVLNYQQNNPDLYDRYEDEYVMYYLHYLQSGYEQGLSGRVSDEQQQAEAEEAEAEKEWQEYLDSLEDDDSESYEDDDSDSYEDE